MKYYLQIDLPWKQASIELKHYLFNNFDVPRLNGWTRTNPTEVLSNCPSLKELSDRLAVEIAYIAFIVYFRSNHSVIHVDADVVNKSRFILPIMNCEDTETVFYSTMAPAIEKKQPNGVPFYFYRKENCTITDKFSLDNGLFLFRIKQPHCVVMSTTKISFPRISCTFAVKNDPTYLLN